MRRVTKALWKAGVFGTKLLSLLGGLLFVGLLMGSVYYDQAYLSLGGGTLSGGLTLSAGDLTLGLGQKVILDDDGDTYIESIVDDRIDIYSNGGLALTFVPIQWSVNAGMLMTGGRGFRPETRTANPCAATSNWPEGSLMWNSTSEYYCYCPASGGAALKVSDDTACF